MQRKLFPAFYQACLKASFGVNRVGTTTNEPDMSRSVNLLLNVRIFARVLVLGTF